MHHVNVGELLGISHAKLLSAQIMNECFDVAHSMPSNTPCTTEYESFVEQVHQSILVRITAYC